MWMLFRPWRRPRRVAPRLPRPVVPRRRPGLFVEPLESRVVPSTYYVSPDGDDGNPGTTPDSAWQTLDQVNRTAFQPGDAILLQGGATFTGSLTLDATKEPGSAAAPITFGSYGDGTAVISSGGAPGLIDHDAGGLVLSNLAFVGSPGGTDGLILDSSRTDAPVSFLRFDRLDVGGYGGSGVHFNVDVSGLGYGFDDVQITDSTVHNNLGDGIRADGVSRYTPYPHTNFYIGHDTVAANFGNGIYLAGVNGATVERNEVHDNGHTLQVGVLAAYAANVTVQHNEAYANRNGLGFDSGVTDSLIQYNYVHDNAGSGLRLTGVAGRLANIGVRYNIAQNNAQVGGYGISVDESGSGLAILNNVVFAAAGHGPDVGVYNSYRTGPELHNNVLITTGGVTLVSGSLGKFQGNAYWSSGAAFNLDGSSSLADWQALTGQEVLNRQPVGLAINPQLTDPGGGGTIGDPDQLETLTAYQLRQNSPLIDTGLDVRARFGLDPGPTDFYGTPLPRYNGYDFGAAEYAATLPQAPNAPGNLMVAQATFREVDLTWQSNSTNEAGFRVQRSPDGVTFTTVGIVSAGVTRYSDTPVDPITTYYYRVQAFNAGGTALSAVVTAVTPAPFLPPGWTEGDIGGPFKPGFASQDPTSGTWTVAGGGTDIWNNADQFHFVSGNFTGDGTLTARVTNTQNTDTWSKAGVMFRADTSAGSAFVDVVGTYGQGVSFQWRTTAGGDPASVTTATVIHTPVWVRLTRSGNNFSGYYSTDGSTWTQLGLTIAVDMGGTARAGLAVTAHNNLALNTASFTGVSLLPAVLTDADVGAPALPGGVVFSPAVGSWALSGAGSDIWNAADQFHFASQPLAGDGVVTAQVASLTNTDPWAKAGVMFRDSTAPGAVFADVLVTPGNGVAFQWRGSTGGQPNDVHVLGLSAPLWVQLVRQGNDFSGYYSSDGVTWAQVGTTQTITMSTTALAGLAVTSHNTAAVATAVFTNVSVLPSGWGDADVGAPGLPGYVVNDAARAAWTVVGGGADIWNSADQFHYLFQGLAGDGTLVARVTGVQNTNVWAKAGVMFRDSLDPGARFVDVLVTPGNGVAFQWRTTPGAVPNNVNVTGLSAPQWLKLVRAGNAFSGYYSGDGVTWVQVGTTQTVGIGTASYAGLAVTAHDDTALSAATFTNVALQPAGPAPGSGHRAGLVQVAAAVAGVIPAEEPPRLPPPSPTPVEVGRAFPPDAPELAAPARTTADALHARPRRTPAEVIDLLAAMARRSGGLRNFLPEPLYFPEPRLR